MGRINRSREGPSTMARMPAVERSWSRSVRGYLLLPHLAPVLVVELATAAFAVIAWGGVPPAHLLLPLLLAMLGGQLAIGATNELVDLPVRRRRQTLEAIAERGRLDSRRPDNGHHRSGHDGRVRDALWHPRRLVSSRSARDWGSRTISGSSGQLGRGCRISSRCLCCRSGFLPPWENRNQGCCCSTRSAHWRRSACISPRRSLTWRSIARPDCRRRRVALAAADVRFRLADDALRAGLGLARR